MHVTRFVLVVQLCVTGFHLSFDKVFGVTYKIAVVNWISIECLHLRMR